MSKEDIAKKNSSLKIEFYIFTDIVDFHISEKGKLTEICSSVATQIQNANELYTIMKDF